MKKNVNRRYFLNKSLLGIAGTGLIATGGCIRTDKYLKENFVHHVFFWLKQPVTSEMKVKFESALKELVKIETILEYHIGVPAPTNRTVIDTTYAYSLLTIFRNKVDQDFYQTHPKHLKFIEESQELWEKVVVYDSISI